MTGAELAKLCTEPWVGTLTCFAGMKSAPQYPMAVDRACWVGEPVAMVVGRNARRSRGCRREGPDRLGGTAGGHRKEDRARCRTPAIHPDLGDNLAFRKAIDTGNVEACSPTADLVVEDTFDFGRHTAVSLEPRGAGRLRQGTGKLTVHTPANART